MTSLRVSPRNSPRRMSPRKSPLRSGSPGRAGAMTPENKSPPRNSPRKSPLRSGSPGRAGAMTPERKSSPRNSPRKSSPRKSSPRKSFESKYERNDDVDNLINEISRLGTGGYKGVASLIRDYYSDEDFLFAAINGDNDTVNELINGISNDVLNYALELVINEFDEGYNVPLLNLLQYDNVISAMITDQELYNKVINILENNTYLPLVRELYPRVRDAVKRSIKEKEDYQKNTINRFVESKYDRNHEADDLINSIISPPGNPKIGYGPIASIIRDYADNDEEFLDAIENDNDFKLNESLINTVSKEVLLDTIRDIDAGYRTYLVKYDRVISLLANMFVDDNYDDKERAKLYYDILSRSPENKIVFDKLNKKIRANRGILYLFTDSFEFNGNILNHNILSKVLNDPEYYKEILIDWTKYMDDDHDPEILIKILLKNDSDDAISLFVYFKNIKPLFYENTIKRIIRNSRDDSYLDESNENPYKLLLNKIMDKIVEEKINKTKYKDGNKCNIM